MTEGLVLDTVSIMLRGMTLVRIDARIAPGEILTVMGPSGSGKSTLLSFVIGALSPEFQASGRVLLDGRDITTLPTAERRIGLLFQDALLFPHLSVGGNLAFALPPRMSRAARRAAIEAALCEAGLEGFAERDPATLSGGQRARIALLRALLAEPRALLLDEPFSRLDAERRGSIRNFVFRTARARGIPVILVTHDESDARAAGGAIVAPLAKGTDRAARPSMEKER
ncbi:MAG: ATP-binding cassette domain-containing protein [Rubricella sp.]